MNIHVRIAAIRGGRCTPNKAMWRWTRFTDYSWERWTVRGQRSEVRGRTTDGGRLKNKQKKRGRLRSNQRIIADLKAPIIAWNSLLMRYSASNRTMGCGRRLPVIISAVIELADP